MYRRKARWRKSKTISKEGGGGGTMKRTKKEVNVFTRHQIAIARRTLEMSDAGALIMGGMTKEEARAILNRNSKG